MIELPVAVRTKKTQVTLSIHDTHKGIRREIRHGLDVANLNMLIVAALLAGLSSLLHLSTSVVRDIASPILDNSQQQHSSSGLFVTAVADPPVASTIEKGATALLARARLSGRGVAEFVVVVGRTRSGAKAILPYLDKALAKLQHYRAVAVLAPIGVVDVGLTNGPLFQRDSHSLA